MGKASISIAITSNFNGKGVDAAIRKMEQLAVSSVAAHGKFGAAAVKAGSELGKASHLVSNFGKAMAQVGDTLTTHVTVPMGIAAAAAIKSAVDIDTAWYNVRKTVDMTEDGYQKLKQGAIELSNVQPVSADTILNIEALGGQLGISNEKLESFAQTVSGLDIATNLNSDEAATSLARFANIVQMSEDDFDNFSSALVDLGNHTATTESEIMELALRFASAGHVAGMSNQEILGIAASLSALGMKADAGGSALSQVINKISTEIDTNGEHLETWAQLAGKSVEDFKNAWKNDAAGTFEDVLQGIARSGDEMNAVLDDVGVTQIRTSDAMRRLASSGDLMSESIQRANTAWKENTALNREVENRNESLASQFEVIKNRLTNAMAAIGEPIAKMTLKALDGLDPMIQGVQDLATSFSNAGPVTQQFAFNLGATAMAAGPVLSILGRGIDIAGQFGVKIARTTQQFGVFTEALHTNDVAMLTNLTENDSLAAKLGVSRNAAVRAAGGVEQYRARVKAATEVVSEQARRQEAASQATQRYAEALGVSANNTSKTAQATSKSAEATQYATSVRDFYTQALQNGARSETEAAQVALRAAAIQKEFNAAIAAGADPVATLQSLTEKYAHNTSQSAVAASKAAKEATGYSSAVKGSAKNATEAAQAAVKYSKSQENVSKQNKKAADAAKNLTHEQIEAVSKTKEFSDELEKQGESAQKSTSILGGLKNVLLGIGGMAISAALFAGLEYLAAKAQVAAERAQELDTATRGLREAVDGSATSFNEATENHQEFVNSLGQAVQHVDTAIQKQGELGDTFREVDASVATQIGTLDRARETIAQYANQEGLTASEQYRLKSAIEAVNEACGTQYTVVDASRGIIADETGAWLDNANAILQNIDARKKQIQLEAVETKYKAAYENLIDMRQAHTEATVKLTKATERYNELRDRGTANLNDDELKEYLDLQLQINDLTEAVDRSSEALDEAQVTLDKTEGQLDSTAESASRAGDALSSFLADSGNALSSYLSEWGADVGEFDAACHDMGLNFEALNSLSEEEASAMAKNFHGHTMDIVDSLKGMGEHGQEILTNLGNNWSSQFSKDTQTLISQVSSARNESEAELMAWALDLGVKGETATRMFMEGMQSYLNPDSAANLAKSVYSAFQDNISPEQMDALGQRIGHAFRDGLSPEQANAIAAAYSAALSQGLSTGDAVNRAEEAGRRIGEVVKEGMSPEAAQAASTAYSKALSDGLSVDDAITKVNSFIDGINAATAQLSPETAAAVMSAFSAAINNGASLDDAVTKIQEGVDRINNSTANLSPEQASAAMQAFASAINSGVSLDEAVRQVNDAMDRIEQATSGLSPDVASAAMQAFANALNNGATFDDAAKSVEDAIQQIKEATEGLNEADAAAVMKAFCEKFNENMSLEEAIAKAKEEAERLKQGVQDTLNNASFDSSGWQAKFAELGRVGPEAFNQEIQGWGPTLSDSTGQIVTDAVNGIDPHVETWSQKGNEGPQAYNNSLSPWISTIFGTTSDIAGQAVSGLETGVSDAGTAGSDTGNSYANTIGSAESIAYAAALATQTGVIGAYQLGILIAGLAGMATAEAYTTSLQTSGAGALGIGQTIASNAVSGLAAGATIALTTGNTTGQNYVLGFQGGGVGALGAGQTIASNAVSGLSYGSTIALTTGNTTGLNYVLGVQGGGAGALGAGQAIASNAVSGLSYGTTAALTTGNTTGQNYVLGVQGQQGAALAAGQTLASMTVSGLDSGAVPAMTSGTTTGTNYVTGVNSQQGAASSAGRTLASNVISGLDTGKGPARTSGETTGSNYARGVSSKTGAASDAGRAVASAAKSAMSAFAGQAYHSGVALGLNFAAGVAEGGRAAVENARSIASQVAAILKHSTPKEGPLRDDDVWGLHFAQNIATGIAQGTPAIAAASQKLAATMATPVASATASYAAVQSALTKTTVPTFDGALITNSQLSRYTTYADRVDRNSPVYKAGVSVSKDYAREVSSSSPGIDYDTMFRVVEAGVASAIKKSGGLAPTIQLDGRNVSKVLAPHMDRELGRLSRIRG